MDIDLLGLEPHKVSRDLRGYSVFFFGEPKSGKTIDKNYFTESQISNFDELSSFIPLIFTPIRKGVKDEREKTISNSRFIC